MLKLFADADMMNGWGYGPMDGGNNWFGGIFMLFIFIILIALAFWAVRYYGKMGNSALADDVLDVLKKRYANGEIDTKEYEEKRKVLSK